MPEIDPTIDRALDPDELLRRGLLPLGRKPAVPPISLSVMPPRIGPLGVPRLPAGTSEAPPMNISPPLMSRATEPSSATAPLSSAPILSTVARVPAPPPSSEIVRPDPNDPKYRPLSGWRGALAALSQSAGIPTKNGIEPLEGLRDIGRNALAGPGLRLAADTAAFKGNLETRKMQADTAHTEAETEALGNKPPAGSPEDQVYNQHMRGGPGGGPEINPATQKPWTADEAFAATRISKPEAEKEYKPYMVGGSEVLGQQRGEKIFDQQGKDITAQAKPYEKPQENRFEELPVGGVSHKVEIDAKGNIVKDWGAVPLSAAPEATQDRKDARTMGYALDKDGNLSYMSMADAGKIHSTFEEMKPGDVKADRVSIRLLSDVQKNTSQYTKAAKDYENSDLSVTKRSLDNTNIDNLLNKAGVASFNVDIAGGKVDLPLLSGFLEGLSRESKSSSYGNLSTEGKALYDGYIRNMSAIVAYQKALTNSARANKETLELEMANIANPTMAPADIVRKQGQFQENIDILADGFPNNLPGIKTPETVRKETEGGAADTQIHAGYEYTKGADGQWHKGKKAQ